MLDATAALWIAIGISLATQAFLVWGFTRLVRRWSASLLGDAQCPEAAVVLCLRGGDPFLNRCIRGLLSQDYPDYRIVFVVDHVSDPALAILRTELETCDETHFEILFLEEPLPSCSLKCSSLVQAYRSLPESVAILAQLDADTIPHPSWLRELATGMAPERVGAATGNRWYMPERASRGALVRHVWNAAAMVQMSWYGIAWGGTLAIKTRAIRDAKLEEHWSRALCEDTMLARQLATIDQTVAFVPSLIMVNREDCELNAFVPWVTRQLLTARLYHRAWPLVVAHGIASAAILFMGWLWCAWLAILGHWGHALGIALSMGIFQVALLLLVRWIGLAVEARIAARGESTAWNRPRFGHWLWIVTLTQWVYTWALLRCMASRSTDWRGIRYRVDGPWCISMLGYRPYSESPRRDDAPTQKSL